MALKYAAVLRGNIVLADCSQELGTFRSVAVKLTSEIPSRTEKCSFPYDTLLYSYVTANDFVFTVVSPESKKALAFACIDSIKSEFLKEVGLKALDAPAGAFDRSFGPRLKYWLDHYSSNSEDLSKLGGLQKKVESIKNIMLHNIEEVIQRGEKLADMDDKAEMLAFEADKFKEAGVTLRKKMWWQQTKWRMIMGGACVALLVVIVIIIIVLVVKK